MKWTFDGWGLERVKGSGDWKGVWRSGKGTEPVLTREVKGDATRVGDSGVGPWEGPEEEAVGGEELNPMIP